MVVIRVMLALYVNYSNYSKNNVVLDNVRCGTGMANFEESVHLTACCHKSRKGAR
jgi:hypothetical protein